MGEIKEWKNAEEAAKIVIHAMEKYKNLIAANEFAPAAMDAFQVVRIHSFVAASPVQIPLFYSERFASSLF
jgi:hypothetical protein